MQTQCSNCGANLNVTDKALGHKVRCPKCKEIFAVESADSAADAVASLDKGYPPVVPQSVQATESSPPHVMKTSENEIPSPPQKENILTNHHTTWARLPRNAKIGISAGGLVVLVILGLFVTRDNADVALVKNGTMPQYGTAIIGKAFEVSFTDGHWEAFETKKGQRVVQFTGRIGEEIHWACLPDELISETELRKKMGRKLTAEDQKKQEDVLRYLFPIRREWTAEDQKKQDAFCPIGAPVSFQWQIDPDGKTFQLSAMDMKSWAQVSDSPASILEVILH
ncbi:MAG: MJ0042-type zinc finger domain-containing protein [Phycisphaerales bacterium]